jgi:hypothetical protein
VDVLIFWSGWPKRLRSTDRSMAELTRRSRVAILGLGACIVVTALFGIFAASSKDPIWGSSGAVSTMSSARYFHTATLLPNGKVLVVGGFGNSGNSLSTDNGLSSAELYDPSSNSWSPTGAMAARRSGHTATLLPSGQVLVAGGDERGSAELYDPTGGTWTPAGTMQTPRAQHTATLLPNGTVLIVGGHPLT